MLVSFICLLSFKFTLAQFGIVENIGYAEDGPLYITSESRLHTDLFSNKNKSFPLVNKQLDVQFGLTLISIIDVEQPNEAIVIKAYIRQKWNNPGFKWLPQDYENITKINVHPDITWTPDIFSYANIEDDKKYNGLLNTVKTNIIVSSDGTHSWLAPVILRLSCTMNVKDFPFETQACPLQFGSFTYDRSRINLIPEDVDMKKYEVCSEWEFKSMNHTRKEETFPGVNEPFTDIIYTVVLKRKPLYLIINLIAPNMVLALTALIVFVLPVTGGERQSFVITILLALCWFMTSAATTMPSSSEAIPFFSYFLGMTLLVVFFLSICLCYSTACNYANCNIVTLPTWVQNYILGNLTLYFGIEVKRKQPRWRTKLQNLKDSLSINGEESFLSVDPGTLWSHEGKCETTFTSQKLRENLVEVLGNETVHEIHLRVHQILEKLEDADEIAWKQREWHLVSVTLDKLFFYIFTGILLVTVFSCAIRLAQMP